jgi:hypothetical protein
MNHRATSRRKFVTGAGACALALAMIATPSGRSLALTALIDLVEITERVARFPCWIVDHSKCFSMDRFDPTCPQCI